MTEKHEVRDFWDAASCGELYAVGSDPRERLAQHARARYQLEPYIADFAQFESSKDQDVLEIGVGMGADHLRLAEAHPKCLVGVDLTPRAVAYTRERLQLFGQQPRVLVGDAECLPFPDRSFDLVYSWGCLHHSPDTGRAVSEVYRVLRTGGRCRIMIYHSASPVGWLLWLRYALLRGRVLMTLRDVYGMYLESPGTKAFSRSEARSLFREFSAVRISVKLSFGDLLLGDVGQRHRSVALAVLKKLWPRWMLRQFDGVVGLQLLIEGIK
ncbi:MAG: class I SAM-dependent methyltransferase [Acidobacteria bacterium]|nr:class I SAM-dependent methyltransferase [Acidobacteriota bacterium]